MRHQRTNSRADCLSLVSSAVSVCASCFAWAIVDCALYCLVSQSGAFIVCALLQQLRCCSLHSPGFTPCFDLTNSGEQCNRPSQPYHQWINHESSMTISRCQSPIDHYESIVNHKNTTIIAKNQQSHRVTFFSPSRNTRKQARINPNFKMRVIEEDPSKGACLPRPGFRYNG